MSQYRCGICGKKHSPLPMDIAQQYPHDYFSIPPQEREQRIQVTSDLCVIDNNRFFIRGYLPIPVFVDKQEFGWGLWVEVEPSSFDQYLELYNADGAGEAPFRGRLSAQLKCYEPSVYKLPVNVHLRGVNERPLLLFSDLVEHPLAKEQRQGITIERVHEILRQSLPSLFEKLDQS